jgi:hypothetical protein
MIMANLSEGNTGKWISHLDMTSRWENFLKLVPKIPIHLKELCENEEPLSIGRYQETYHRVKGVIYNHLTNKTNKQKQPVQFTLCIHGFCICRFNQQQIKNIF